MRRSRFYLRRVGFITLVALVLACVMINAGPAPTSSLADGAGSTQKSISGDDSESQYGYSGPVAADGSVPQSASCITTRTEIRCVLP